MTAPLSRNDVRIAKAADKAGAWYVMASMPHLVFKNPQGDLRRQLTFYVEDEGAAFAALLSGGYTTTIDRVYAGVST